MPKRFGLYNDLYLLISSHIAETKSTKKWNPVVGDQKLPAELETSYLHVRTDSIVGSSDRTFVVYYDESGRRSGGIGIAFLDTMIKYRLINCQEYTAFPTSLPEEQDKHWVIKKRGMRTIIFCNDKQVLDIAASSVTCDESEFAEHDIWATRWERKVSAIIFRGVTDTASDAYYLGKLIKI